MSAICIQLGQSIAKGQWFDVDQFSDFDEIKSTLEQKYNHGLEYGGDVLVTDSEGLAVPFTGKYGSFDWNAFIECASDADKYLDHAESAIIAFIEYYGSWDSEAFQDSYEGEYNSDIDFAEQLAESMGAVNDDAVWPYTCIDWDHAARELMYDYHADNGHYFRCM